MREQLYLFGLAGSAGSGKSTAARILVQQYGFKQIAFADTLKDMLRVTFRSMGWDDDKIERHINGDLKEAPIPELGMTHSRHMQQTLGTEWGRERVYSRMWVVLLEARIQALLSTGVTRIVVDDVRMSNEADAILNTDFPFDNYAIFKLMPEGTPRRRPGTHQSEVGLQPPLVTADLVHDYSLPMLAKEIERKIIKPFGLTSEGPWTHG